jgi:hypothetical protein
MVLAGTQDLALIMAGVYLVLDGMTLFTIHGTLMVEWVGAIILGILTAVLAGDIILGAAIGVGEVVGTTIVGVTT